MGRGDQGLATSPGWIAGGGGQRGRKHLTTARLAQGMV